MRTPGSLSFQTTSAETVEAATRSPNSISDCGCEVPSRTMMPPAAVKPNQARPVGMPTVSATTRMVCTMAMARMSALYSTDSAITCASAPGLEPSSADTGSQPCTYLRYALVAMIMHTVDTASTATLSGNAASPFSVSGLTTAPSEMPTSTEITRASGAGTVTGCPASAALATPSSEPVTSPAGKPSQVSRMPPAAP